MSPAWKSTLAHIRFFFSSVVRTSYCVPPYDNSHKRNSMSVFFVCPRPSSCWLFSPSMLSPFTRRVSLSSSSSPAMRTTHKHKIIINRWIVNCHIRTHFSVSHLTVPVRPAATPAQKGLSPDRAPSDIWCVTAIDERLWGQLSHITSALCDVFVMFACLISWDCRRRFMPGVVSVLTNRAACDVVNFSRTRKHAHDELW